MSFLNFLYKQLLALGISNFISLSQMLGLGTDTLFLNPLLFCHPESCSSAMKCVLLALGFLWFLERHCSCLSRTVQNQRNASSTAEGHVYNEQRTTRRNKVENPNHPFAVFLYQVCTLIDFDVSGSQHWIQFSIIPIISVFEKHSIILVFWCYRMLLVFKVVETIQYSKLLKHTPHSVAAVQLLGF